MELRQLGATGLQVSRIGLGLAALGRPAYINLGHADDLQRDYAVDAMRRRAARVLDAAWAAGVRYVDAARSYGRAEEFLASWLHGRASDQRPVVGSKWGYEYTAGWRLDADRHEVKEHSLDMFTRQLAESRALLDGDMALYQVHSATLDSGVLDDDRLLDALAGLRAGGTAVGLTVSGPGQADTVERALEIERDGVELFMTVQATWNVLEPSSGHMLAAAHSAGLGVMVKEGVANGRLTPRTPDTRIRQVVEPIAAGAGVTIDAVALAVILAQPWADVVLSGAATVDHLHANTAAVDVHLSPDDRAALSALVEEPPDYWARRSDLAWG